jgi:hypothetical protein
VLSRPVLTDQQSSTRRSGLSNASSMGWWRSLTVDVLVACVFQAETDHQVGRGHDLTFINVASVRIPRVPSQRREFTLAGLLACTFHRM